MSGRRLVVVVAGGDEIPAGALAGLGQPQLVVAADSGLDHALVLGLAVDVLVGDLDSASPAALDAAERHGTHVDRHPVAKDQTDLELALDHAVAAGATDVVLLGGHGGRLDHLLANVLLLTADRYVGVRLEARFGDARAHVVRDELAVAGTPGELLTLLAVGGPATGVTTAGLRYPLRAETLHPGSTRGVSNELVDEHATVRLQSGVLLAVRPGPRP